MLVGARLEADEAQDLAGRLGAARVSSRATEGRPSRMASGFWRERRCRPISTLSNTVWPVNTLVFWKVRTTPSSAIWLGLRPISDVPR